MSSIMTMLMPAAIGVGETRDLSAGGPAESKQFFGDLKGSERSTFSSTLRAAERAQDSSKANSKVERMESRPHQKSRPRAVDEQNELPGRAVNDRRFSDDGFSDDDRGDAQPAETPAGCHDGNQGSEAAVTGSTIAEQAGELLSQDRSEPSPEMPSDLLAPQQWAWLTGVSQRETVGVSLLKGESAQDGRDTMAPSEPLSSSGPLMPPFSLVATGLSALERHDMAVQGRDENDEGLLPTRPSVPLSEVSVGGPSPGDNRELRPAPADSSAWPLEDPLNRPSATSTQEPTRLRDLTEIEISLNVGRNDPSPGKRGGVEKSPTQEKPSPCSLGQGMSLHAVSSHSAFSGGEVPSADLSISSLSEVDPAQLESHMSPHEQLKRYDETIRAELQNQQFSVISSGSGQEQIMRLIQRPEMVPAVGLSPQSAQAEAERLDDATPAVRTAPIGLTQDAPGAVLPRTVAFEVSGPELGHINVRVAVRNELVHAHMLSDRPEVAAYLATGHDRLQSALQASGLEMGHFRVDVDRHGANRSFHQNASPEQGWSWQPEQRRSESLRDQADWSRRPDLLSTGLLNVIA